jgi:ribonuclease T
MPEVFISVDVETAGPNPGTYALLSIGACLVDDPDEGFYVELIPETDVVNAGSIEIGGLSLDRLAAHGLPAGEAMLLFADWMRANVPDGDKPIFVGFNAPFDWMFVCDYFERFTAGNPFGHSAVDIKAYYFGMTGGTWADTSMRYLGPKYLAGRELSHNALNDARDQAELFRAIRAEGDERRKTR